MDKAKAVEFQKRLIAISAALNAELRGLDPEDRATFVRPLAELVFDLHDEVLEPLYHRFPELRPIPEDFDEIDTNLRWEDVTLPPSISEADLDAMIISKLKPRSLKVAKVLGDVMTIGKERGRSINHQIRAARIERLAETDQIARFGAGRTWRYSALALND